jgi:hypothetical protein
MRAWCVGTVRTRHMGGELLTTSRSPDLAGPVAHAASWLAWLDRVRRLQVLVVYTNVFQEQLQQFS